jgi:hypothetical protein
MDFLTMAFSDSQMLTPVMVINGILAQADNLADWFQ